jgi:xylose dehydrogenase (NAD/NADP)
MKRRLNWGILGTGAIAGALASAVRQSETGELLAVGSRSGDASHAFGERFGVTRCYPTYDALLADPDV